MFARPICFKLFVHWVRAAASRTFCTAGTSKAIKMAMMAITTKSSISVKPRRFGERMALSLEETEVLRTNATKPGERLRHAKVQGVRVVLGDGSLLLGVDVPVVGDEFLGNDVRVGWTGRVTLGEVGRLAVAFRDANQVLAGLQASLAFDPIFSIGDHHLSLRVL